MVHIRPMKKTLLDRTIDLIHESDFNVSRMCADLDISTRWYYRFMRGDFDDPGVKRIEKIHDYLLKQRRKSAA